MSNKRGQSDFVSDIFYIFTLYLAKSSGVFLYLRLTPNKYHVRFCWAIFGASTLWALASILAVVIRCHGSTPWIMDEQCNNMVRLCSSIHRAFHLTAVQFLRWQIIGAFDVVTEAALFGMAIFLVQGLRMPLRLKVFVVGAFAIRLP